MQKLYNLHVALGLHWYQPHTQKKEVLLRIIDNTYRPVLSALENIRFGSVACDITASLILQLANEAPDVISRLCALKKAKKITIVNTAAYHPILPLVPEEFTKQQLDTNEIILREHGLFSAKEKPRGIFPPEMAFDEKLLPVLKTAEYEWVVADDLPYNTVHKKPTPAEWLIKRGGITCLMRSRLWSNIMSMQMPRGDDFANNLFNNFSMQFANSVYQAYIVLWTDTETFGEWHPNGAKHFLEPFIREKRNLPIWLVSPEDLLRLYPPRDEFMPAGSWSSEAPEISHAPFAYWNNPSDEWHRSWWNLADLAQKISAKHPDAAPVCRRALHSCQTWAWSVNRSKDLFLWAVPDFKKILEYGTPKERKTGDALISRLSDY